MQGALTHLLSSGQTRVGDSLVLINPFHCDIQQTSLSWPEVFTRLQIVYATCHAEADHSSEIYAGDVCIFQLNRQPKSGDIVAVHLKQSNQRMVKTLKHKDADEVELASANKFRNYPSVTLKKDEIAAFGLFAGKIKLTRGK